MDDLDAITNEDDFQDANNDIPPDDVNNIGNVINPIVNVPNIINPYRAPPIVNSPADKSKEVNDQIQETKRLATDVRGQAAQYRRVSSQQ